MKSKWIALIAGLVLIAGSAGVLMRLKATQKLGQPGVLTSPIPGSKNLLVVLPSNLPGYNAVPIETEKLVIETLPKDTSFGQMYYTNASGDGFSAAISVVLMGSDRTSLHKPEFCLEGAGWRIDAKATTTVPVGKPSPYELPVRKFLTTKQGMQDGRVTTMRGIYVFWFVAQDRIAANHWERMWDMAEEMLKTGVLQRWAYVSYFSVCPPGQEEATYERMKQFIASTVPEFQLVPGPARTGQAVAAR